MYVNDSLVAARVLYASFFRGLCFHILTLCFNRHLIKGVNMSILFALDIFRRDPRRRRYSPRRIR